MLSFMLRCLPLQKLRELLSRVLNIPVVDDVVPNRRSPAFCGRRSSSRRFPEFQHGSYCAQQNGGDHEISRLRPENRGVKPISGVWGSRNRLSQPAGDSYRDFHRDSDSAHHDGSHFIRFRQDHPACRAVLALPASAEPDLSFLPGFSSQEAKGGHTSRHTNSLVEIGRPERAIQLHDHQRVFGERGRNRTFNLLIKSQLLCQLSYAPIFCILKSLEPFCLALHSPL